MPTRSPTPACVIARVLLVLCLALAIGFGLLIPLLSLNRRRTAKRVEVGDSRIRCAAAYRSPRRRPQRRSVSGIAGRRHDGSRADGRLRRVVNPTWLYRIGSSAAAFASLGLIWLILAGPGFMGHGASLLWAGAPREGMRAGFYDIVVAPASDSVRKKSDQVVSAQLVGFDSRNCHAVREIRRHQQVGTSSDGCRSLRVQDSSSCSRVCRHRSNITSNRMVSNRRTIILTAIDLAGHQEASCHLSVPEMGRSEGRRRRTRRRSARDRRHRGNGRDRDRQASRPWRASILDDGNRIDLQKAEGQLADCPRADQRTACITSRQSRRAKTFA